MGPALCAYFWAFYFPVPGVYVAFILVSEFQIVTCFGILAAAFLRCEAVISNKNLIELYIVTLIA